MMTGFMMVVACVLKHQETRKPAWLAGVVIFVLYASLLRHNAIFGAIPFFFYVANTVYQPRIFRTAMAFIALLMVTILINHTIAGLPMVKRQVVWPTLVLWDLAHISVRENVVLLPEFTVGPGMTTADLSSALSPWTNVTLFAGTKAGINNGLFEPYSKEQYQTLFKTWALAIADYPGAYLQHRAELSSGLYGFRSYPLVLAHAYGGRIVQFKDNPEFKLNQTRLNRFILIPLTRHVESWPFKGWIYAVLCIVLSLLAWPLRQKIRYQRVLLLSVSGLFFTAPLLIIAPAAPMRFHSWLVMSALIALAALISAFIRNRKGQWGRLIARDNS
jgi:hypothetical protein